MGNALSKRQSELLEQLSGATMNQRATAAVSVSLLGVIFYAAISKKADKKTREAGDSSVVIGEGSIHRKGSSRVAVDGVFLGRLKRLLGIMIPSPLSAEAIYLMLVAITMLARTWCDVWMLRNGTSIERAIIGRDYNSFLVHFFKFVMAFFPLAVINNFLKYGLDELHIRFRKRITTYLFKEYLKGFTYYKVSNLDNRISNADQLLTQDVDKFCNSVAQLYSNISKPILDIVIYARKLTGAIGVQGPLSMLGYLVVSGVVLTRLRRPVGKFTVTEQRLEGDFRYVNSRLITHSEEIAFYRGNKKEQYVITQTFERLIDHLRTFHQFRFGLGVIDSIIAKYIATVVGYLVVSRPFFDMANPKMANASHAELMEEYYRSGRMLMNMAIAVGRLVLAGREMTRLAGYTARVTELEEVLKDLNAGQYKRTMISDSKASAAEMNLFPNAGKIVHKDHVIKFDDVPVVTPNGDVLVKSMNFEVKSGMNVLVCGPNGCGKSSLFRILGELWPLFGGVLTKPTPENLFYVPQRPYLCLGSLRDQIIYPHTLEDMHAAGRSDDDLKVFLEDVQLAYLVTREGQQGLDTVSDWSDVLSGGEKQRVAMARLFYHKPQFAILDECTSAVSVDVEGFMYERCREIGITLFTVSHRKSLWKHHEYVLQFDGRGQVDFKEISSTEVYGS